MSRRLGRKAVYLGTVVGVLALVAGFAMAAVFTNTTVGSAQNGFSANTTGTIWATPTNPVTLVPGTSSNTCTATAPTNSISNPAPDTLNVVLGTPATQTIYVGLTGACAVTDFAEEWSFSVTVNAAATDHDTFAVFSSWTQSTTAQSAVGATAVTMAISGTTATSTLVTLNVVVDYGFNVAPASISSLNVVVTGS